MDVQIEELTSTVRAVDSHSLVAPQTMRRIVAAVMKAMHDQKTHEARVQAEQRVTQGVRAEQEGGQ